MAAILSPGRRRILVLLALWLGAGTAYGGPCDLLGGDGDGDGICDDASDSGALGDLPCSCPVGAPPECAASCDDNCPWLANPTQLDVGRVGDPDLPDGIGDACQCHDVSDDGRGNVLDSVLYARAAASPLPELAAPEKCRGPGPTACDATDVANCGACGFDCSNAHGSTSCVASECAPVCVGLWGDCDNHPEDGCEVSLNSCGSTACCTSSALGSVSGDDAGCAPTAGMIELSAPADVNYNLYLTVPAGVTCQRWTGSFWTSSPSCNSVNGSGIADRVRFVNAEGCTPPDPGDAVDQTFSVTAEIRHSNGYGCGDWTLTASSGSGCY